MDELDRPIDAEQLRTLARQHIKASQTYYSESLVPKGREADFPNIVFNEQVMRAVMGETKEINMAALSLLKKEQSRSSKPNDDDQATITQTMHLIAGIQNRL